MAPPWTGGGECGCEGRTGGGARLHPGGDGLAACRALPALRPRAAPPRGAPVLLATLCLACEAVGRRFDPGSVQAGAGSFLLLLPAGAVALTFSLVLTALDPEVAAVVEQQADPYREQLPAATIVRTVDAYDDLCGESAGGPLGALEELRLSTGHDHRPQVVEALARVLGRSGLTRAGAG